MRLPCIAAVAVILFSGVAAYADTFSTFKLTAFLVQGSADGTVTLDTTTNTFTGGDFIFTAGAQHFVFGGTPSFLEVGPYAQFAFGDAGTDAFFLDFPINTFAGYTGGDLCSEVVICTIFGEHVRSAFLPGTGTTFPLTKDEVLAGDLTQPAAIPEPSSIVLLTTGLLGMAGLLRRRHA